MEINIQSLHFTASKELNDFVTEKVNKLSNHFDKIESATVSLKLENSDTTENKVCEIRLAVPGNDLFAKKQGKSFEEAVKEVVDILQVQIIKMKSKTEST